MKPRQIQLLTVLGVLVAVLAAVVVTVLVVGWGDPEAAPTSSAANTTTSTPTSTTSPGSTTTSSTSTTTSSTTSTSTTTTTSTSTTTTTTLPPGACTGAGAGPPPDWDALSEVPGDFDGDGAEDRLSVHRRAGGDRVLRLELSYGYSAEVDLPDPSELNLKAVNLGGPADLAVTEWDATMAVWQITFFRFFDCRLEVAPLSGGGLANFPVGSDEGGIGGLICTAGGITVTQGERTGVDRIEASALSYSWNPEAGHFSATVGTARVLTSPEDDEAIRALADYDC